MTQVMAIRDFPPGLTHADIKDFLEQNEGCMNSWSTEWTHSFRDPAGSRTVCFYQAPDAESVRNAIRQSGWTGDALVKSVTDTKTPNTQIPNVVVERHFDAATSIEALQATEDKHAWCLDQYQVTFIETYFSLDRRTMICLYHAPDAESVRNAQHQATMPFDAIWACEKIDPSCFD